MNDHYILVGQTPVPIECDAVTPEGQANLLEWARTLEISNRRVAETWLWWKRCRVSTVFLGLDHNFHRILFGDRSLPPLLFETMSFWYLGGAYDHHQERCSTWSEAEQQHRRIVRDCRKPWVALRCFWGAAVEKPESWHPVIKLSIGFLVLVVVLCLLLAYLKAYGGVKNG